MGNKRKLNKYKNVPKFNFATVGIAIGVGLIVLLLVFFFKITFEEPNVNVVGSVEQRGSKVAKTTNPPKKVVVKPQKEGKPSIGDEKKTKEKNRLPPGRLLVGWCMLFRLVLSGIKRGLFC